MANKSLPHLIIVTVLGVVLGLLTAILLPLLFVVWLQSWIMATREPAPLPHRCAGDAIKAEQDGWIDELEARLTG